MVSTYQINLGEDGSAVERYSEVVNVWDRVAIRCVAVEGSVVATRMPVPWRGFGNHVGEARTRGFPTGEQCPARACVPTVVGRPIVCLGVAGGDTRGQLL